VAPDEVSSLDARLELREIWIAADGIQSGANASLAAGQGVFCQLWTRATVSPSGPNLMNGLRFLILPSRADRATARTGPESDRQGTTLNSRAFESAVPKPVGSAGSRLHHWQASVAPGTTKEAAPPARCAAKSKS
jgi:hypothetical protein